ncbi:DUF4411 family protein [Saccharomonospora iraqiensis]|uniref:DUF4411 family protein n=1 Tax=Saccharomonospora iraqiensis TaxID=52698 RepID=UPI0012B62903|nr:DUF4411 family protein [Saccharomonospora iraqiensis]
MYLLDANAFMEAARLYYGFDFAPGFWDWLEDPILGGRVGSVAAVRTEILAGKGELVDWANKLPAEFWLEDSADSLDNLARLATWANDKDRPYGQAAVSDFMASADIRIIALAMAVGGVVVTREVPAPQSKTRVKIPDVCRAFEVPYETPFEVYRQLGMKLVAPSVS